MILTCRTLYSCSIHFNANTQNKKKWSIIPKPENLGGGDGGSSGYGSEKTGYWREMGLRKPKSWWDKATVTVYMVNHGAWMQGDISAEACQGWIRHSERFFLRCTARQDRTRDILVYLWKFSKLASSCLCTGNFFFLKFCKSLCKDGENINVTKANWSGISDAFLLGCAVYNSFAISVKVKDLTLG